MKHLKQWVSLGILGGMLLTGGISMLMGRKASSDSERRKLTQWPKITSASILNGTFMQNAEKAAADQFPFRDTFRSLKALYLHYGVHQLDNNGIYVHKGNAGKLDYPLNSASLRHVLEVIHKIQEKYLDETDVRCYYSVVPDKGYFLAKPLRYPVMDYAAMVSTMQESLDYPYIDLFSVLSLEDYYKTDPHWRQEALEPAAGVLAEAMGVPKPTGFSPVEIGSLAGAYVGQSALPLKADPLFYLTSDRLKDVTVFDPVKNVEIPLYDLEKAQGRDPYELFLCGPYPLQVIENPHADSGRELILFRDSFGSSMAPLLAQSYAKITVVDLRYMQSDLLENYIDFQDQDVLFLYSTLILNNGMTLR